MSTRPLLLVFVLVCKRCTNRLDTRTRTKNVGVSLSTVRNGPGSGLETARSNGFVRGPADRTKKIFAVQSGGKARVARGGGRTVLLKIRQQMG